MRIAVYSRKSRLSETGESIRSQIEMCIEYAVKWFDAKERDIAIYEEACVII